MKLNIWLTKNHDNLLEITSNITKGHYDTNELYQSVILQLLEKPEKIQNLTDKEKTYYFIRVIKNNWHSNTSPFRYQELKYQQRHVFNEEQIYEQEETEYHEEKEPDLQWVKEQLESLDWFHRDIFLLWLEVGSLINVHRETTIPINSVGNYIKKVKEVLKIRWDEENK